MTDSQRKRQPPPVEARIAALAGRQHGVVALRQLLALGLSRSAVAYRVRSGRLHRVMPGALAVGHHLLTPKGRFMAAVLSCGEGAMLSHHSAARHRDLLGGGFALVDVCCPRQRRARAGLRVHIARRLELRDVTVHDGIPVTSVARTLLDLADVAPRRLVERAIHQAEILRVFDLRAVDDVLDRANGHRGAAVLREALAQEPAFTRSELEEALLALARGGGLPSPLMNTVVEGFEVDAYWPEHRLAVELDSRRYHLTTKRFESDRERDVLLLKAGVRTARITDKRLSTAPQAVADDLRELLSIPIQPVRHRIERRRSAPPDEPGGRDALSAPHLR